MARLWVKQLYSALCDMQTNVTIFCNREVIPLHRGEKMLHFTWTKILAILNDCEWTPANCKTPDLHLRSAAQPPHL